MNELWEQLKGIWGNMTPTRRWTVGGILAIVVAGFVWVIASQAGTSWRTVAKAVNADDLKDGVTALEAKSIPVRLQENNILQVPEEHYDAARLELATHSGTAGGIGMELFNESTFGQSAFQEAINYHRALEGELARTIRSINGVESARVHLVIPKKRLFKKDQKAPTASVKLSLGKRIVLSKKQLKGIRHLVASAIEGLQNTMVTVVDQMGNMLASPRTNDGSEDAEAEFARQNHFYKLQARYEAKMEGKLLELLEPLAGEGKVRAQVTMEMDFSEVSITENDLNPDKQVSVTEERSSESSQVDDPAKAGVPGVASNIPGRVTAAQGNAANARQSQKESVKYNTANSVTRTQLPVGRLKRVSVAVAIGGTSATDDDGNTTWEPRTADEMKQFNDLVAKAVGYDKQRGDQVTVITSQFEMPKVQEAVIPVGSSPWIREAIKWGSILLLMLLFAFGVVRPLSKAVIPPAAALVPAMGPPLVDESLEGMAGSVAAGALPESTEFVEEGAPSGERLRLRAVESTQQNPEKAAQIIRAWLLVEE
jgi:flagellar M-ring protein FliF